MGQDADQIDKETLIGAVTSPISRPTTIIAGCSGTTGWSSSAGPARSPPRNPHTLGPVLEPAGVDHPWPDTIIANQFGGSRARTEITRGRTHRGRRGRRRHNRAGQVLPPRTSIPPFPARPDIDGSTGAAGCYAARRVESTATSDGSLRSWDNVSQIIQQVQELEQAVCIADLAHRFIFFQMSKPAMDRGGMARSAAVAASMTASRGSVSTRFRARL